MFEKYKNILIKQLVYYTLYQSLFATGIQLYW